MDTVLEFDTYDQLYSKNKLIMWLDISTHCNASCPQCHRTRAGYRHHYEKDENGNFIGPFHITQVDWLPLVQWSIEDFTKAFSRKTLSNIEGFDICGTWGDPIMNKDILKIIHYIKYNSSSWIQINTNGSIRDSEWWWELGVLGDKRLEVIFDIDGVTQKEHSLYRQGTNLEKILDNMKTLSNTKAKATVFTVIFEHNRKSMYDIAQLCKENGAKHIVFLVSNRFSINEKEFDFFNKENKLQTLVKSTDNLKDFYWKHYDLFNTEQMEIIKNASH